MSTVPPTWTLSIIIPCLNEEGSIEGVLQPLLGQPGLEVLVVDGGSVDHSVAKARELGATVLESPPGRAVQMNFGAAHARGRILLFLHADTRLPEDFIGLVDRTLSRPETVAGAFRLAIDLHGVTVRVIEAMANWRSTFLQLPYGDQAIFLRKSVFKEVGGFPEEVFLEDLLLMRRLRRLGRINIAPAAALTSGRRWQQLGVVRTTLLNQLILLGLFFNLSPHRLEKFYRLRQKG